MAKAVGIGGVFLKARDPEALGRWYAENLGIPAQDGGSLAFEGPESAGMTVFAHFPMDTKYFGEGAQPVMVNFRVDDLDGLLKKLDAAGVRIDPKRDDTSTANSRGYGIRKGIAWSCGSWHLPSEEGGGD